MVSPNGQCRPELDVAWNSTQCGVKTTFVWMRILLLNICCVWSQLKVISYNICLNEDPVVEYLLCMVTTEGNILQHLFEWGSCCWIFGLPIFAAGADGATVSQRGQTVPHAARATTSIIMILPYFRHGCLSRFEALYSAHWSLRTLRSVGANSTETPLTPVTWLLASHSRRC